LAESAPEVGEHGGLEEGAGPSQGGTTYANIGIFTLKKTNIPGQHVVTDTLAALVYDVNATAEVLRRGSLKHKKAPKTHEVDLGGELASKLA